MKYSFRIMTGFIFGSLFLASCGGKKQQTPPPPPPSVGIAVVEKEKVLYYEQYPGTIVPLNEVELRAQVSGYLTGIYFQDGQHVTKGQKLYTIDQQQYLGTYEQALANLNVAKANLAKIQQDVDRYTELAKNDAIAKQTLDHAIADLNAAKMQVAAAQANVKSVQTGLKYSTIYAPVSGTIGISQVKLGAAVLPGQTLLNTISSDDPMATDFYVGQEELPRFIQLQQAAGKVKSDSVFKLKLPDNSMYTYPGTIYAIDRAVDPQTATIKVRLMFSNLKKVLRPGMSSVVLVKNTSDTPQIVIPYKAVLEQMSEYFVFILGDSNKVQQQKVLLGSQIDGGRVIVKSGLQEGQKIVTDGVQRLRNGVAVSIAQPGQQQAPAQQGQPANKPSATDSTKKLDAQK